MQTYASFLMALLAGSLAKAAIVRPLNNLERIEASISQTNLTRISLQNDRIRSVFGVADEYSLEADENHGEIFIRPLHSNPIHLTITTENGFTQDLRLIPTERSTEALILTKQPTVAPVRGEKSPLIRTEVEELLEACQRNRIPLGYTLSPITLTTAKFSYLLVRDIRNEKLKGLTFEIKSPVTEAKFAKTCGLPLQDIVAIVIETNPFRGGHIYVVARVHP
jgi:hypothetical protein